MVTESRSGCGTRCPCQFVDARHQRCGSHTWLAWPFLGTRTVERGLAVPRSHRRLGQVSGRRLAEHRPASGQWSGSNCHPKVSWVPCLCDPAQADRTRGSGHLTVTCRSPAGPLAAARGGGSRRTTRSQLADSAGGVHGGYRRLVASCRGPPRRTSMRLVRRAGVYRDAQLRPHRPRPANATGRSVVAQAPSPGPPTERRSGRPGRAGSRRAPATAGRPRPRSGLPGSRPASCGRQRCRCPRWRRLGWRRLGWRHRRGRPHREGRACRSRGRRDRCCLDHRHRDHRHRGHRHRDQPRLGWKLGRISIVAVWFPPRRRRGSIRWGAGG